MKKRSKSFLRHAKSGLLSNFGMIGEAIDKRTGERGRERREALEKRASRREKKQQFSKRPVDERALERSLRRAQRQAALEAHQTSRARRVASAWRDVVDAIDSASDALTRRARELEQAAAEASVRIGADGRARPGVTGATGGLASDVAAGADKDEKSSTPVVKRLAPWLIAKNLSIAAGTAYGSVITGNLWAKAARQRPQDRSLLGDVTDYASGALGGSAIGMGIGAAFAPLTAGASIPAGAVIGAGVGAGGVAAAKLWASFAELLSEKKGGGPLYDEIKIVASQTLTIKAREIEFRTQRRRGESWLSYITGFGASARKSRSLGSGAVDSGGGVNGGGSGSRSGGDVGGSETSTDRPAPAQSNGPSRGYQRRQGERGEFNYALTPEGKRELGLDQSGVLRDDQKQVLKTKSGHSYVVNREDAGQIKGFVDALEGRGYHVNSIGGFANRGKAGGGGLSTHATGSTIDINPGANPFRGSKTDMPSDIEDIAGLFGRSWGGKFGDPMHFERMGPTAWRSHLDDMVKRGVIDQGTADYVFKNRRLPAGLLKDGQIVKDYKFDPKTADEKLAPDKPSTPDAVKGAEREQYEDSVKKNPFGMTGEKPKPQSLFDDTDATRKESRETSSYQQSQREIGDDPRWKQWRRSDNVEDRRDAGTGTGDLFDPTPVSQASPIGSKESSVTDQQTRLWARSVRRGAGSQLAADAGVQDISPRPNFDDRFGDWGEPLVPDAEKTHVILKDRAMRSYVSDSEGYSIDDNSGYDEGPTMREYVGGDTSGGT